MGHIGAQKSLRMMDREFVEHKEFDDDIPQLLKRHELAKLDKRKWLFVIGAGEYKETLDILYSRHSAELFAQVASKILGILTRVGV